MSGLSPERREELTQAFRAAAWLEKTSRDNHEWAAFEDDALERIAALRADWIAAEREAGAAEVRARVEAVIADLHDEVQSRANRHVPHIAGEVSGLQMAEHRLRAALNGGE